MLNGHGDDIYKSNTEIKANFSTNVWYDADTDILRSMLITQIDSITRSLPPNHSCGKLPDSITCNRKT